MITIATVLRSGGDFSPFWVRALHNQIVRHYGGAFRFVCLTDDPQVPRQWAIPLQYGWRGWWAKMELFRPGLFTGPVFYPDLDSLFVGDPSGLFGYRGELALLRAFYQEERYQNGLMAWTPGKVTEDLWKLWIEQPNHGIRALRGPGLWMDARVGEYCPKGPDRLQELFPGQIESLKPLGRVGEGPSEGVRIVCGHGSPRFSSHAAGWAHRYWLESADPSFLDREQVLR